MHDSKDVTSKNIDNNMNSPCHTILPDMDHETCHHLSLATVLERWLECGNRATLQWLFYKGETTRASEAKEQDEEANQGKQACLQAVTRAINDEKFKSSKNLPEVLTIFFP